MATACQPGVVVPSPTFLIGRTDGTSEVQGGTVGGAISMYCVFVLACGMACCCHVVPCERLCCVFVGSLTTESLEM